MHKFSYENTYPEQLPVEVEFTVPSDADLNDMLEQFESYLKAVGFSFDGNIDIVPEHSFDDTVRDADEAVNSKKKLWDATPEEWNNAYKSVKVTYTGNEDLVYTGPRQK